MILGNVCTRPCGFCSVPKGKTEELEDDEPERVAEAARRLGLKHVVITSVTRDDLPDGGAEHFRRTVEAVRQATGASIEVLVPDFIGKSGALEQLLKSRPDVFNHTLKQYHDSTGKSVGAKVCMNGPSITRGYKKNHAGYENQEWINAWARRNTRRIASGVCRFIKSRR